MLLCQRTWYLKVKTSISILNLKMCGFINDFKNTVLGIDKDNYYAYKSKPISDESSKLFNEYMYKAIP